MRVVKKRRRKCKNEVPRLFWGNTRSTIGWATPSNEVGVRAIRGDLDV